MPACSCCQNWEVDVFISADIEGITGLVSWSQCEGPKGDHYDFGFARRMYTHDVNAAIRGARAAGARRVVVKDSHGGCKNLLVEDLEPCTELISGISFNPDGMMEGIDSTFAAAVLVGYHANAGRIGVMSHALVGGLHRFWINGAESGEIAVSAAIAGSYGVPLVAVTSDDAGCAEAAEFIPGVYTYAVKETIGYYMARLKHPAETGVGVEAAVRDGVASSKGIQAKVYDGKCTMRLAFQTTNLADIPAGLPGVTRVDGYTVEWSCPSFAEANHLAQAVFNISHLGRKTRD
jgi:D-amino peptidase